MAEVERDVRTLLGGQGASAGLDEANTEEVYRRYNMANFVVAKVGEDAVVLSPEGAAGPSGSIFLDSNRKRLVRVSHRAGAGAPIDESAAGISLSGLSQLDPSLEEHRAALAAAVAKHIGSCYNPGGAGSQPWARGSEVYSKDGSLVIITSVTVRNLSNFWSGSWRARYTVGFPGGLSAGKAAITGTVNTVTHYFENGNTQMHGERAVGPLYIDFRDHETFAKAAARAISEAEDGLLDGLGDMYDTLSATALKEMRRALPVSAQKMNWNPAAHRLVKQFHSGQK